MCGGTILANRSRTEKNNGCECASFELRVFNTAALRPNQPKLPTPEHVHLDGCAQLQESLRPPPSGVAVTVSGLLLCETAGNDEPPAAASSAEALVVCDSIIVVLVSFLYFFLLLLIFQHLFSSLVPPPHPNTHTQCTIITPAPHHHPCIFHPLLLFLQLLLLCVCVCWQSTSYALLAVAGDLPS